MLRRGRACEISLRGAGVCALCLGVIGCGWAAQSAGLAGISGPMMHVSHTRVHVRKRI